MPNLHEVVDRIHYENRCDYTNKQGNVAYLDGTPLTRPFSMPMFQRLIAAAIFVVAVIIGFSLINTLVISRWQEVAAFEKSITNNLSRQASIETIPVLPGTVTLDDETIKSMFAEAGLTMCDVTALSDSYDLALYRVPPDMTVDEVAALYTQGLGSLNAEQASKLFTGGWFFGVNRADTTSMLVRYADFSTGDPQIAIQNAIIKQGFDPSTTTESGEDDSGNTFVSGTFAAGDGTYSWKVSALPLSDMYSIADLPKDACYVGIRCTRV